MSRFMKPAESCFDLDRETVESGFRNTLFNPNNPRYAAGSAYCGGLTSSGLSASDTRATNRFLPATLQPACCHAAKRLFVSSSLDACRVVCALLLDGHRSLPGERVTDTGSTEWHQAAPYLALGSGALVVVAAGSGGTGGTGCSVSAGGAHAEGVDRLGLGSEGTRRELSRYCDVVHFMSKAGYFNVKETKYAFLGVWGGAVA